MREQHLPVNRSQIYISRPLQPHNSEIHGYVHRYINTIPFQTVGKIS